MNNLDILNQMVIFALSKRIKDGDNLSDLDIKECILKFNETLKVDEKDVERIYEEILRCFDVTMEKGTAITTLETRDNKWFAKLKTNQQTPYFERFRTYLHINQNWTPNVINKLDDRTDEILNFLGNPNELEPFTRKGLLIGDVQSGKTINYTAICNKAADAGYKVIVLLTGTIESLRKQTQLRMMQDFVGKSSLKGNGVSPITTIGVGTCNPSLDVVAFTTETKDFNRAFIQQNNLSLRALKAPALFVVKKNKSVLDNLNTWLTHFNQGNNSSIDLPLLVIDDESDYASINTKDVFNPTAINYGIRKLLNNFTRKSYLAVTATPYANIFINDENYNDEIGGDLFPEDFIYLLDPPTTYIGNEIMFSEEKDHPSIVEIDVFDENTIYSYKKDDILEELPADLIEALNTFLIICGIMDYRLENRKIVIPHRTMLVNMSQYISIQNQLHELIRDWLKAVQSSVNHYAKLLPKDYAGNFALMKLESTWEKYFEGKVEISWDQIRREYLACAVKKVETRVINQKSQSRLDYSEYEEGLSVIAVGGNGLSRGITLEGLVVSYFYRNTKMYDTLMQMGRWFGYRPGYEDIFKVWMTPDYIAWYRFITSATKELKEEVLKMNRIGMTPKDFGLMVRQHPDTLVVTAANKMRDAEVVISKLNLSSKLVETPRLINESRELKRNEKVFRYFIEKLDIDMETLKDAGGVIYDVARRDVVELISNFSVHPWSWQFNSEGIADFINTRDELKLWDVYIPQGTGKTLSINTKESVLDLKVQTRPILVTDTNEVLVNKKKVRVGAGGTTKKGLDERQLESVESMPRTKKNPSDNDYLSIERKPLLVLHIIEPSNIDENDCRNYCGEDFLFALGIGFPKIEITSEADLATYVINPVKLRSQMTLVDWDGDDDADDE